MKNINMDNVFTLVMVIMVMVGATGTSYFGGMYMGDRHAVAGLGGESTESVLASALAMRFSHNHTQANAILAAAGKHGQYGMAGMFDLAHHAW